ncbi:hypothetical protein SAMN02799624_02495 [Paenibacillus sp. UNC496MF]|uniref:hypothetical protein n=1 Tax=Paenibacillus sp. UNC496MF TaxID=1502753 RepID=UPI0008E9EBA7|nr:hypothetical protein [Paenibacillus sp. UNC496MF]SFI88540.1 hypothetical protein SAMN02799624_02495 [Paenibacillus sp. UNC496MF]
MTVLLLTALLLITFIFLIMTIFRHGRQQLFKPIVVTGIVFSIFYIFDMFFTLWDASRSKSFLLSSRMFIYEEKSLVLTGLFIVVCIWAWTIGDHFAGRILTKKNKSVLAEEVNVGFYSIVNKKHHVVVLGLIALLITGSIFSVFNSFINSLGGFEWYSNNISARSLIFQNASVLYSGLQIISVFSSIVCAMLYIHCFKIKFSWSVFLIGTMLFLAIIAIGLLTGARANVIKSLFIVGFVWSMYGSKLKLNFKAVIVIISIAILSIFYSQSTRNLESDQSYISSVFNTEEVSQANNLYLLIQYNPHLHLDGGSIINGALAAVPRSVMGIIGLDKEKGANAVFTQTFWPTRWTDSKSEVALGVIGEIVLNFGFWITPFILLIIAGLYNLLFVFFAKAKLFQPWLQLLQVGLLWSIFQLLRGDIFNTINNFALFVIPVLSLAGISSLMSYYSTSASSKNNLNQLKKINVHPVFIK